MLSTRQKFLRRKQRVRRQLAKAATGKPRLSVFRSGKHIYAQIIDDKAGATLVAASTLDKDVKGDVAKGTTKDAAAVVGKIVATRAAEKGIKDVIFDRGGYRFHGRVKALADAAREGGLAF